jgi:MFS family permease
MISNSNYTSRLRLNVRGFVALIGVLLVCFGQQMVAKTDEMATPSNILGIWINDTLRLGLPTIDHVLQGFLLLLAGGALLAFYINGLHLYSEEAQPSHRPLNIGLMRSAWPFALIGAVLFGGLLLQLQRAEYHSSSPWIWVISLSIFLGIVVVWDWRRGVNLSPDLPRQDLMWLVGLLIAGLLIVTYRLQGWPDQLMHDEGIFGSTARDVAMGTFKPPIFAQGVNMFPILSTFWPG